MIRDLFLALDRADEMYMSNDEIDLVKLCNEFNGTIIAQANDGVTFLSFEKKLFRIFCSLNKPPIELNSDIARCFAHVLLKSYKELEEDGNYVCLDLSVNRDHEEALLASQILIPNISLKCCLKTYFKIHEIDCGSSLEVKLKRALEPDGLDPSWLCMAVEKEFLVDERYIMPRLRALLKGLKKE